MTSSVTKKSSDTVGSKLKIGFWFIIGNWFLIGNGVAVVLAWRFPNVARTGGIIKSEYSVQYGAIGSIFLITGLSLSTPALWSQAHNYRLHLITQLLSFIVYPTFTFALLNIIKASRNDQIDMYILIGIQFVGCACTSIASNISMTIAGGGNGEAATVEVVLGNTLGVLLSPLLNQMFFSAPGWSQGIPLAADGAPGLAGLGEMYRRVMMKLGLAMMVPFALGQVIQYFFFKQTKKAVRILHLQKVSSALLITLIWSVFSTQFYNDAFSSIPPASIILVVFMIIILYTGFSALACFIARLPFLSPSFGLVPPRQISETGVMNGQKYSTMGKIIKGYRLTKGETTAVCYCAAAKGLAVGTPMMDVLYGGFGARERAIISIPFGLYQLEQVVMAQLLSHVFKKWNDRPDIYFPDEAEAEKTSGPLTSLELRSRQAEIESVLIDEGK